MALANKMARIVWAPMAKNEVYRRRMSVCGRPVVDEANDTWAMDFVSERLFDGRAFRIPTIVDCHTREALATSARASFRAYQVIELDFSRPVKPSDDGFIEAFNVRLRAECPNAAWFVSMTDARQRIEE